MLNPQSNLFFFVVVLFCFVLCFLSRCLFLFHFSSSSLSLPIDCVNLQNFQNNTICYAYIHRNET